jgi:hypothetical protein
MEIRVQRTVSVKPQFVRGFISAALDAEQHGSKVMGVESETFYNVHGSNGTAEFRIFTDFDGMAQYEDRFLGKLLSDTQYLEMAEKAVEMITDEPLDELFVRLKPDDYFMNVKARGAQRPTFSFEKAERRPKKKLRYRREREYCASKGRLRDVMQMNFQFMEDFYRASGSVPDYFCTRFSVERIGCSKMYFDFDDCPVCGPAFLEQDQVISARGDDLLLTKPADSLYMRVTPEDANFNLKVAVR